MKRYTYKNLIFILPVLALLSGFLIWYYGRTIQPGESLSGPYVRIDNRIISVEIADTFPKQVRGLSDRPSLGRDCGMLFVFPRRQVQRFWMKNMRFPLDIIWIDGKKVVNISENLSPEGERPSRTYDSIFPVNYVLEVNAGFCQKYGIKAGDSVKISY